MSISSSTTTTFLILFFIFLVPVLRADVIAKGCGEPCDIDGEENVERIFARLYTMMESGDEPVIKRGNTGAYLLCRGDVGHADCMSCYLDSLVTILDLCLRTRTAMTYSDYCYLLYTDSPYFGTTYDDNIYYCSAGDSAPDDPDAFYSVLRTMLKVFADHAARETYFASGSLKLNENVHLHSYVQCSNEISKNDCQACLYSIINQIPGSCVYGRIGGRIVTGSCIVRYELYPFINTS